MDPNAETPRIALHQGGVFTPAQAAAEGWSARQCERRLAARRWRTVLGKALCGSGVEVGALGLAHAVALSVPGGVVSHELAAALWGFPVQPSPVVSVPPERRVRIRGLRVMRRDVPLAEQGAFGAVSVTNPRRTALDLLASLSLDDARDLLAWLMTHGELTVDDLAAAADQRAGLRGNSQLRELARMSRDGSLSAAEDRLHDILRRGGLTGWTANAPVVVGGLVRARADVLFARERVVIEVDGWRTHSGREAFQRDRTKQNALAAAGYTVLRFTWADLVERPDHVLSTIRRALNLAQRP